MTSLARVPACVTNVVCDPARCGLPQVMVEVENSKMVLQSRGAAALLIC